MTPARTDWLDGLVVTNGGVLTDKLAAVVVAVPTLLVNTARYWVPEIAVVAVNKYVAEVAPAMLVQVVPSVLDCHCTVGAGEPEAAAVSIAVAPAAADRLTGLVVTVGDELTVSVAAVVTEYKPWELVNTA